MDAGTDAPLFVYPQTDPVFVERVATSLASLGGRPVEDPALVAAAAALLRASYPLARIEPRLDTSAGGRAVWDVFRDDTTFDFELVRRARAGDQGATEQLQRRHLRLASAMAIAVLGPSTAATAAVAAAFRAVIADDADLESVRVRLAAAARDEALRLMTDQERRDVEARGPAATIIELAHGHHLPDTEIAAVLRIEVGEVREFEDELLAYAARSEETLRTREDRASRPSR